MLIVLLLLLILFSILEHFEYIKSEIYFKFFVILLILIDAIKLGSGTDYYFYYNDYYNYLSDANFVSRYEPLYSLLSKIAIAINLPYHIFLLIFYSCYYFLISFTIRKYSPFPILSLLLLFSISIGLFGSNRQLMALGILFFMSFYTHNIHKFCKFFVFLCFLFLASMFHYSAIFFAPIIFFNDRISNIFWFIAISIALFLLILKFNIFAVYQLGKLGIPNYSDIIRNYINISESIKPLDYKIIFGIFRRGILIYLLYKYSYKLKIYSFYNLLYNISWFSLLVYIFFYTLIFINSRVGLYFIVFECVSYAILLTILDSRNHKIIFLSLVLLFSVFLFFKNISLYPHLFFPYNTIIGGF